MKAKISKFIDKHPYWFVFLSSYIIAVLIFLPDYIANNGVFLYYGDFNVSQLPEYMNIPTTVKNNEVFGWSWETALGSESWGMLTFGAVTSPFFWLLVPFSQDVILHLMMFVIALKFSVATVLSYAYIKRFTSSNSAMIGAFCYGFCGFMFYNLFFPDFNDVYALFPILLIAMEELIRKNRKLVFALAVLLMLTVHWYYFISEVVFCIIYFIVRSDILKVIYNALAKNNNESEGSRFNLKLPIYQTYNQDFPLTVKKFFTLLFEAVLGVAMGAFVLIPTLTQLSTVSRVTSYRLADSLLTFVDGERFIGFEIIRSLFMFPNMPAFNIYTDLGWRFSSAAVFLPLFGLIGVIAFFKIKKHHWAKPLSLYCLLAILVPVFTMTFYMFQGNAPYMRWLFMPILILCLMTAVSVDKLKEEYANPETTTEKIIEKTTDPETGEEQETEKEVEIPISGPVRKAWIFGFKITALALAIFGIIAYFPVEYIDTVETETSPNSSLSSALNSELSEVTGTFQQTSKIVWGDYPTDKAFFWTGFAIVVFFYVLLYVFVIRKKKIGKNLLALTILSSFICMSSNIYYCYAFKSNEGLKSDYLNQTYYVDDFELPDDEYYRLHTYMPFASQWFLNKSQTTFFGSSLNSSLQAFYDRFIMQNPIPQFNMSSTYYGFMGLLSVKYYVEMRDMKLNDDMQIDEVLPGFEKLKSVDGYDIFENKNYVPMGFAYDYFVTESDISHYTELNIEEPIVYTDFFTEKYKEIFGVTAASMMNTLILTKEQSEKYSDIIELLPMEKFTYDKDVFVQACDDRRSMSCYDFEYDNFGFNTKIDLDKDRLVFFSIPHSTGWSAKVNGKTVDVELVDSGFMAIRVPAGTGNNIEFKYETPGMKSGVGISLAGLGIFIVYSGAVFAFRRRNKKDETKS
jgi:hypothetical protein